MQDAWIAFKAEDTQGYADRNEWKNFFAAITTVYGPTAKGTATLINADKTTPFSEKTKLLKRWAEHFRGVLNRRSTTSDAAVAFLPQLETSADLNLTPSLQENIGAVGMPPDQTRFLVRSTSTAHPTYVSSDNALPGYVETKTSPSEFQGRHNRPSLQAEGSRQICNNHRRISLLNLAGKIFIRILLNHLEQGLLSESHCGFRRHYGTANMIFVANQLQEKCQEMRIHLYSTFVGLTKAFYTVNREGLWEIIQKFDCPERFT
ncbi:hypothetical protein SprV_0100079300 [Sparganum proliferum]